MWFRDEVLYPRFLRSVLWMIIIHIIFVGSSTFFLKLISWHPVYSLSEWLFCLFHWKTIIYQFILASTIIAFGVLNIQFCAVEKHLSSTRFEKICRALSPFCLQHVFAMMCLGGLATYCYVNLLHNFRGNASFIDSCLSLTNEFEQSFVTGHGCFTGMMFSMKYFICNMYLVKFALDQESKVLFIQRKFYDLIKDSFFCVLKAIHWYYLGFIIFGSRLKYLTPYDHADNFIDVVKEIKIFFGMHTITIISEKESIVYNLINPKLFLVTISSGVMISFIWSLYIIIFNSFATERCIFPIKVPVKGNKSTLASALTSKGFGYIKYLAVLDLRLLSQYDVKRREQIFTISNPGGHPHEWKEISKICVPSLQDFVCKLYDYSFAVSTSECKAIPVKTSKIPLSTVKINEAIQKSQSSILDKVYTHLRERPVFSYFLDELPNAKLMKLFASSQPYIWMIDALGYLVTFSYTEDKFGVVQQSLPEIIRLMLDLKMAEEKMPIGLVGIRTYVKDPQGRYEHIHQRLLLKTTVHNALCRIANTFKEDINGIYLPDEYQKYLQRYLGQKS